MESNIAAILAGAAVTFIATAMIHQRMREYVSRRAIRDISTIYEVMIRAVNRTGADRFLILGLHNGGKDIQIGKPRYITVFEEVPSQNVKAIKGDYDRYKVDGTYMRLFNKLLYDRSIHGSVSSMDPGMLREAYEAAGLKHYFLFYIGWKDRVHFFGSITSISSPMVDPQSYTELGIAVDKIRSIINRRKFII